MSKKNELETAGSVAPSVWEMLDEAGRSKETEVSSLLSEPHAVEKSRAAMDLILALRHDDVESAMAANEKLTGFGAGLDDFLSLSEMMAPELDDASPELVVWALKTPWFAARDEALRKAPFQHYKSGIDELVSRMMSNNNRPGLEALADSGAVTLDELFFRSCQQHKQGLALRYGRALLRSGAEPSERALESLCEMSHIWSAGGVASDEHPLDEFFKAWGPKFSEQDKSHAWGRVCQTGDGRLAACLGRHGIEPKEWRLVGQRIRYARGEPKDITDPPLLDYALSHAHCWLQEPALLEGLLAIPAVSDQRESVHPYVFMELSNGDLEALVKKGVKIDGVDQKGRTFLHLRLSEPSYTRPGAAFLMANAKRFPEVWDRSDDSGKTPLEMLDAKELAQVEPALSKGSKAAINRELAGRRGSKPKRRPGL